MATSPLTTELSAVNSMLTAIGNTPISSFIGTLGADVVIARDVLHEQNVKMQSKGWHFNTEYNYPLLPNVDGEIVLPINTLRVDTESHNHPRLDVIQRNGKLYDKATRSYKFTETIKTTLVLFINFDEMPEVARQFAFTRATRIFGNRMVGDRELEGFSLRDEADALSTLKDEEGDTADHNIFDSADTSAPLRR